MTFGLGIPAYRNVAALRRCLHSVVAVSPELAPSLVVADDSGDGRLAAALKREFPQVRWIVHERNLGFGVSANDCVRALPSDVVILLNDDAELASDPLPPLQRAFQDGTLFAVTFQSLLRDGRFREGAKRLAWPCGWPRVLHNPADQLPSMNGIQPSAYAVGGHAAFRRLRFLELGGFDPLFAPFYWEDVDLGERARRAGLRVIYLPQCQVMHDGESAIRSSQDSQFLREITLRNRLLFAWRHAQGMQRVLHQVSLAYHLLLSLFPSHRLFLLAFAVARKRHRQFTLMSRGT
jgi:GT2 family glycosyltransferase